MAKELTQPPTLTAKDAAKVEALIDPVPLPCGGRGLRPGVARTERWSFGKRSTAAVARYHLGMGWPSGILRRTCPHGLDRCLTHRTDDSATVAPTPPHTAPNTVPESSNRTNTPPGGNEPVGHVQPDAALLRGARWATAAADSGQHRHHPPPPGPNVAPPPPPGQTHGTAPAPPPTLPPGGSGSQPPEGGLGAEGTQGQGTGQGQGPPGRLARRRPKPPRPGRRTWGRAWRTLAAVAAAWAAIFGLSRSCAAVTGIDVPDIPINVGPARPNENPPPAPAPTDPTTPPEPTTSTIGPVFPVCPPSWETTTTPIEGCP